MIATKTERTQIHFLSDVPSLPSRRWILKSLLNVLIKIIGGSHAPPPRPFPFYGTVAAQFVFLFLSREIFRETSTEMNVNTVKVMVKNKSAQLHLRKVFCFCRHGPYGYGLGGINSGGN